MNKAELKILMLGARRVGKTSLLAAIIDAFKEPALKQHLLIEDVTPSKQAQVTLAKKTQSLRDFLSKNNGKVIICDEGPTNVFYDYVLNVKIPGESGEMRMTFTDGSGEFYVNGVNRNFETVKEKIKLYDIIIVVVDTPYLMEAVNPNNPHCDEIINEAYNQVDSIHTLLTEIDDNDGQSARLVIFTPLKCERWAKNGQIDKVTQRVEEVYSTTIKGLKAFSNIEIVVLPVQTVGNLVFDSHQEAFIVTHSNGVKNQCTDVYEDGIVRIGNGSYYHLTKYDVHQPDMDSMIEGVNFPKPNSWFQVVNSNYKPHNSEQLAYYILNFLLAKTLRAEKIEQEKKKKDRWWKAAATGVALFLGSVITVAALGAYWYLSERVGSIDLKKLNLAMQNIDGKGLWKSNTDGIKILNKGLLGN